ESIEVMGTQLTGVKGGLPERVEPGTPLLLRLLLRPRRDLSDFTFYFRVRRSTDQLLVYDGHVAAQETDCATLRKDDAVVVDFAFKANVTRGHYFVEVEIFHKASQAFVVRLSPAASFIVDEMRTHAGVADVQLEVCARVGCTQ